MSLSDSDSDFEVPQLDNSEDDSYGDLFAAKKKKSYAADEDGHDESHDHYLPPPRSHVCDECEEVFDEAVFCGECNMTYCLSCDRRYHSSGDELGLKNHFRQPLFGEVPKVLARQVAQLMRQEEEENQAEIDNTFRESAYQTDNRTNQQRQRDDEKEAARIAANAAPPTAFGGEYAGLAQNHSRSDSHDNFHDYQAGKSSSAPRHSPPPPASHTNSWNGQASPSPASPSGMMRQMSLSSSSQPTVTWANPSELTAAYPVAGGYNVQQYPSSSSHDFSYGLPSTLQRSLSSTVRGKVHRPASATPVGHVPRATMILQSTRPTSATVRSAPPPPAQRPRAKVQVTRTTTRMDVVTSSTSLSGKAAFGRNMLLHSTPSAMVHQQMPAKKRSTAGEEGAHTGPGAKGGQWGDLPKHGLLLRELNEQIMALKQEISTLTDARGQYKTSVLKKQRALKEISRIAKNLAKQPNVTSSLSGSSASGHKRTNSNAGATSSLHGGTPADLTGKIASLKTSNEILRLALEEAQAKIDVLRDSDSMKHAGRRELSSLDRERSSLIGQVSIDAAGRELDAFKKYQMVADLEFAIKEMSKTIDEKKKLVNEQKMNRMAAENQTRALETEYKALQTKLDRRSEQEMTQAMEARGYE